MITDNMHLVENLYDKDIKKAASRDGYGEGLVELGKTNPDVVVLCADLTESTRTDKFRDAFPDRFYEMGVSEQNMIAAACGMSMLGKIPFAASFATFVPGRSFDQIRISAGYNRSNVKISGAHAGITVGQDGATHQMMEDISMMRAIPGFTVLVPSDAEETKKAAIAASKIVGPVYIRFGREKMPLFTTSETPFEIGRASLLKEGADVAIIACGIMVYEALIAAKKLEDEGITAMVINMHTIKPLDTEAVKYAAEKCRAIVTAEEHQITGGLGAAVAEAQVKINPVPQEFVGMPDKFGESGGAFELLKKYGMTSSEIVEKARIVIGRKEKAENIKTFVH